MTRDTDILFYTQSMHKANETLSRIFLFFGRFWQAVSKIYIDMQREYINKIILKRKKILAGFTLSDLKLH